MNQNTIPGSARQRCLSRSGEALERSYLYLPPDTWKALYALSSNAGVPVSKYIASLIPTVNGTFKIKENDEYTCPSST